MKRFFRNNGGLLLIAAALLAAVLAIGAQILGFDPLTSALEVLATPFRTASAAVTSWTQAQYDRAFRYDELAVENEALRQRVAQLEQDAIAGQDAQRENERLRDLLGLREERPELQYQDAAVVRRASSNWTADFTIDRGSAGGVEVNDCVIDQYGHLVLPEGDGVRVAQGLLDPGADKPVAHGGAGLVQHPQQGALFLAAPDGLGELQRPPGGEVQLQIALAPGPVHRQAAQVAQVGLLGLLEVARQRPCRLVAHAQAVLVREGALPLLQDAQRSQGLQRLGGAEAGLGDALA